MVRDGHKRRRPARAAAEWRVLVNDWHRSGQSARTYSIEHGIGCKSLYSWASRFRDGGEVVTRSDLSTEGIRFIPVEVSRGFDGCREGSGRATTLEVVWPGGLAVRVSGEVTQELVSAVLRVVGGEASC
jgi:hypothetical protein